MRWQQSLQGLWRYTPVARVTIGSDGTWQSDSSNLPPPGDMAVPSHWERAGLSPFAGTVRFERSFTLPPHQSGESLWLLCRGIDYFATLLINGQVVGTHEGYFQTWECDISHYVQAGENHIALEVTCPQEEPETVWPDHKLMIKGILSHWDCRPGGWDPAHGQDIHSGGIWNDVLLELRPSLSIDTVQVQTRLTPPDHLLSQRMFISNEVDAKAYIARVMVTTTLMAKENVPTADDLWLEVRIGEAVSRTRIGRLSTPSQRVETILTIAQPQLWWTWDHGTPYLYPCTVSVMQAGIVLDNYEQQVGLREVWLDAETGQWTLNRQRIFLRGTNIVPTLWLGDYDEQQIAQDIALLKQAHVNAVRMCVHVNREELYAALDRAGILVWQDFALQWGYQQTDTFIAEAVHQIKDMVRGLRHHPSIALWCCQNESSQFNHDVLDPILAQAAREEDSSRYVRPTSELDEHLYYGWYYGLLEHYQEQPTSSILSEFGAQALPSVEEVQAMVGKTWPPDWKQMDYHNFQYDQTFHVAQITSGENWHAFVTASQQYQATLLKTAIERFRRAKYNPVGSIFQFMFMDCWPSITWSVLSYERQPKAGYYALQTAFQPLLIGTTLERGRGIWAYDPGLPGQHTTQQFTARLAVWLVNDYLRPYEGQVMISLRNTASGQETMLITTSCTVPADSTITLPTLDLSLPKTLSSGAYQLQLALYDSNDDRSLLSTNSYPVQILVQPFDNVHNAHRA